MPPTIHRVPDLYPWTLTFAHGEERTVLASSLANAIGGALPSPIISAVRGVPDAAAPAAPVVTSLVPATAQIGDPSFTIHVHGTGFKPGAVIVFNGFVEPTTFVSATELTTGVNMDVWAAPAALPVAVRSILGLESNSQTFTFTAAARRES